MTLSLIPEVLWLPEACHYAHSIKISSIIYNDESNLSRRLYI